MGRNSLRQEYETLVWRYAADLPMTSKEADRLQDLHSFFLTRKGSEEFKNVGVE
jgi:hypothetical protein